MWGSIYCLSECRWKCLYACLGVCLCVCVRGGGDHCALRRCMLSGGLTGRRAALVLALIDAVCRPGKQLCVSLAGRSRESRDPPQHTHFIPCPGTHRGPSTWTKHTHTVTPPSFSESLSDTQHAYRTSTNSSPRALQQHQAQNTQPARKQIRGRWCFQVFSLWRRCHQNSWDERKRPLFLHLRSLYLPLAVCVQSIHVSYKM